MGRYLTRMDDGRPPLADVIARVAVVHGTHFPRLPGLGAA